MGRVPRGQVNLPKLDRTGTVTLRRQFISYLSKTIGRDKTTNTPISSTTHSPNADTATVTYLDEWKRYIISSFKSGIALAYDGARANAVTRLSTSASDSLAHYAGAKAQFIDSTISQEKVREMITSVLARVIIALSSTPAPTPTQAPISTTTTVPISTPTPIPTHSLGSLKVLAHRVCLSSHNEGRKYAASLLENQAQTQRQIQTLSQRHRQTNSNQPKLEQELTTMEPTPTPISVPDIRQRADYDCGAAAVKSVAEYYHVDLGRTLDDYNKELESTKKDGTETDAIVAWLQQNRLRVTYGWGWTLEQLEFVTSIGSPVILPIQYTESDGRKVGHYVVALISDALSTTIQCPIRGRIEVDSVNLDKNWYDVGADGMKDDHFAIAVFPPYDLAR